jgi:hypothetical protein
MKHCACGRSISPESWKRLPLVGTADDGREIGELIELRNCVCGSTIAKAIGAHRPSSAPRARVASEP